MPKKVVVTLDKPLEGSNGLTRRVVLKEPTYDLYMRLGEPHTIALTPSGAPFSVENTETINAYLAECIVEPTDMLLFSAQADLKTAREVKRALLSFFRLDAEADEASSTSPTNSSSNAAGTPAPSAN